MSETFRHLLRVRYAECDAQQVVFNSRYGEFVDVAMTEFFRAIDFASGDFQLVKQTHEWMAPARWDDVLEISVQCVKLGTTSFTVLYEFRVLGREPVIVRTETVYVHVTAQLEKKPLPQELRDKLTRGSSAVSNHAGVVLPA